MKDFSAEILEPFDLRAKRVTRAYGAFICDTNQGVMLVKAVSEPEGALWFAHGIKEHLARQGFAGTDRYMLSREGLICAELDGETYTVRRWMRVEEAQLTDESCAIRMAAVLGRMHRSAASFEAPAESRIVNRCYEWPQKVYKNCRKLQSYGKILRKSGRYTEFDLMVLSCLPEHIEQAEEAQAFFLSQTYTDLAERADRERAFGHGHYTDHTVLLSRSRSLITDFEQACYMIPIVDFIGFLERTMRKNHWSISLGLRLLSAYDRWYPMDQKEKQMLYAGMLYPNRLCELCAEAYHMKRSWIPISYKRKMEELLAQQEKRKDFLAELARILR